MQTTSDPIIESRPGVTNQAVGGYAIFLISSGRKSSQNPIRCPALQGPGVDADMPLSFHHQIKRREWALHDSGDYPI